jgi:predicted nucleic acid-binding protein
MPDSQNVPSFVDTNIWLYAFIEGDKPEKTIAARNLIRDCQPIVSVQVVNEVCVNLIKKAGFDEEKLRQLIDAFYEKYEVVELDQPSLLVASRLRQRYSLSFWDSLVIASALQSQVETLYSEDIQNDLVIEKSLRVVNPFK